MEEEQYWAYTGYKSLHVPWLPAEMGVCHDQEVMYRASCLCKSSSALVAYIPSMDLACHFQEGAYQLFHQTIVITFLSPA